ncbi:putative disease resistance protein At4g19050 [Ziziphus jujuba]|uniref:Disease resistance protein At4g19050 n=1 Tax=Ziziphus jujuba TaxID=326968 RepID=A0ABM3IEI0_ZIZJJ|nr:putative disease resistance protein At4g19050 [Ziziphus jujuba]
MASRETVKKEIRQMLEDDSVTSIILLGEQGVGKTWMAKEISEICMTEGLTHRNLWVYLNKKYHSKTLLESIERQLSLLSNEEFEDDEEEKEETLENLKLRISTMLEEEATAMKEKTQFVLLILDDVLEDHAKDILSDLPVKGHPHKFFKVLMTIGKTHHQLASEVFKNEIESNNRRLHQMEFLSPDESENLLKEKIKADHVFPHLDQHIATMKNEINKGIPATIITIAEALKYLQKHDSGASLLEGILEEAGNDGKEADYITQLLCCWYDEFHKSCRIDMLHCFWHSMQHFHTHSGVHYNELITHWIIEGYFGCFDQIQKAYEQGHEVLMHLINCGMLSKQEDNIVIMNQAISRITHHRHSVFNKTASLGLPIVFDGKDDKWEGLGRITQTSGMRKSLHGHKNWEKVSTLLMDGSFLSREVPETFFQPLRGLQVFAIFNPLFSFLPLPLLSLENLVVLVLRGCDLLEKIDDICELRNLCVLEISSAASLNAIPPDLFENLPNLQVLNLSSSKIESLPRSLFKQPKLRQLILRQCHRLKALPSLKELENLEVIDLCGADSLIKIQDKNFAPLRKLQMLDLSKSKIDRLPFLHNLEKLTGLMLSDCPSLTRLPSLQSLCSLQILDASNARNLVEIHDDPFDNKVDLQIVDLSGTAVRQLPSNISYLSSLYLKDCSSFEILPSTKALKNLKKLDLSGTSELHEIEDKSFEHLRYLQILNFSKAKIKELPSLSNLGNLLEIFLTNCSNLQKLPILNGLKRLKKLYLSGCVELVELPSLNALEKLEDLDLSGCRALEVIQANSFEKMIGLRILNLSETKIKSLPTLCNPSNLSHLILQNCIGLKILSPLEHLTKLEELVLCGACSLEETKAQFLEGMKDLQILDLSGTPLTTLPSLSNLTNLRKLTLRGCSGLKTVPGMEALKNLEHIDLCGTAIERLPSLNIYCRLHQLLLKDCSNLEELQNLNSLTQLEVLDLSGTRIKKFPYEISELTCLERLDLPDLKDVLEIDLGKIKYLPKELNWDQCGLFKDTAKLVKCEKPTIFVRGKEIFQCLEKSPELWNKYFKQFHFVVGHHMKQDEDGDINFSKDRLFFRDVYFHTRYFCIPVEDVQLLEIHGSYILPNGFESVLKHTKYLSLVDNKSISRLSKLGAHNVAEMRGYWIDRCTKMESILDGEEVDIRLGSNLEILWVSNLPSLKNIYSGTEGFKNLKHLYLDCCPVILNVFSSSQFPENLEIVHVKFCDKLDTLFESGTMEGRKLQKLHTLYLFELPELRSIGIQLACQPTIRACPKLVLDQVDSKNHKGFEI